MPRSPLPSPKLLTIAILAVLPAISAYAGPQSTPQHDRHQQQDSNDARPAPAQRENSLSDAVRRVERNTRGEVLSAERVQYDGRDMHRVKVVDDNGRVRVFMQDPNRRNDGNRNDGNRNGNSRRDDNSSRQGNERGNDSSNRRQPPTRDDDD